MNTYTDTITVAIFDLDSTIVTIEGIDTLVNNHPDAAHIAHLTHQAMNGDIPFDEIFFQRLDILRPNKQDILELGKRYRATVTPGATTMIDTLKKHEVDIFVVSGAYNPAVTMVTQTLGIPDSHVYANELLFDTNDTYVGVNRDIPLWKNSGKKEIVETIRSRYPGRAVMIGDGATDAAAAEATDAFICFAGVAHRPAVAARADTIITEPDLRQVASAILAL